MAQNRDKVNTKLEYTLLMHKTPIGYVCMLCGCNFINNRSYIELEKHFKKSHAEFDEEYPFGSNDRILEVC